MASRGYVSFEQFALKIERKELQKALRLVGKAIKQEAQSLILAGGTGRKYGKHQASAPGQAPASLTGKLGNSIKISVRKNTVRVLDTAYYATILETGAKNVGRPPKGSGKKGRAAGVIAPRPYLTQALAKTDAQTILDAALQNILQQKTP